MQRWGEASTAGQHLVLPSVMEHQLQLHTIPFLIFLISGCPGLRGWLEPTAEGKRWYSDGVCVWSRTDTPGLRWCRAGYSAATPAAIMPAGLTGVTENKSERSYELLSADRAVQPVSAASQSVYWGPFSGGHPQHSNILQWPSWSSLYRPRIQSLTPASLVTKQ